MFDLTFKPFQFNETTICVSAETEAGKAWIAKHVSPMAIGFTIPKSKGPELEEAIIAAGLKFGEEV
jgi:hypothetical protein